MAGDIRYSIDIDNSPAIRAIDSLKAQISSIGGTLAGAFAFSEIGIVASRFEDLRTSLQILYKDAQTGANAFDDIKKMASATVFSVEDLTQTVIKLKAAGIEPTVKLLTMFADVSSVAADKVGALQAITDLYSRTTAGGLGLEDLNRLADRGIPVFTILEERLGLSRLSISELGKTAGGAQVILRALEDGLQEAFPDASAARAKNVSQAFSNFKDALANAADAIGQAGLNEALVLLLKALGGLAQGITPLFEIIAKLINLIVQLGNLFVVAAQQVPGLTEALKVFFGVLAGAALVRFTTAILSVTRILPVLTAGFAALGVVISPTLALFAAGAALAAGAYSLLKGKTDDAAKSEGFKVFKDGKLGAGTEDLRKKAEALNEALNKFKVEMNAVVEAFGRYNKNAREALDLDTALLGTSRENQNQRRNEAEINKRLGEEIAKLKEQKAKLTEEERKQGRAGIIDNTIKKLEEQAKADIAAGNAAIASSEQGQRADSLRLFGIRSQEEAQKNIRKVQDDMAKMTMPELARQEYDILAAARERAQNEIEAEQIRRGSLLTDAEKQVYQQKALALSDEQITKNRELYGQSRTFETGWKQAFNQYADNATNAAEQAKMVFTKFTQGMEDMLVNFFKTGKFGWKNFLAGMAEDLLRSNIRQLMTSVLGGGMPGGGGGGIFGGIGKLLGFANGGIIPTNGPVVVGERGPELLMGAAGMNVVPNNALGGTSVTYNINAVDASSFKSLIARDPAFIHAVAMQGAASIPRR